MANKEYYQTHKEEFKIKNRERYLKNKEKYLIKNKERYEKNKNEILARQRRWYQENIEERRAYNKKRYTNIDCERVKARQLRIRLEVLDHYDNKCACCGETIAQFLTVDHINNDGNIHRKNMSGSGSKIYFWLKKNNYPDGFQILCYNCNCAKGHYGICPHQVRKEN
jgi:predicted restriction endonuclease